MSTDCTSNASSKRSPSQKNRRVMFAMSLKCAIQISKPLSSLSYRERTEHRKHPSRNQWNPLTAASVSPFVHNSRNSSTHLFLTILNVWSAYTSGGPTAMPTEASVLSQPGSTMISEISLVEEVSYDAWKELRTDAFHVLAECGQIMAE